MLERILEQLMGTLLDTGVTVYEACQVVRYIGARQAALRILSSTGRENKSRVAAITGLSRTEVTRLLKLGKATPRNIRLSQHPIQRIIDAWLSIPAYLSKTGEPAEILIYGRKTSFERLTTKFSASIPIRAIVDEMVRMNLVDIINGKKIRLKSRLIVNRGLSEASIRAVGIHTSDLVRTLTYNLNATKEPMLETTLLVPRIPIKAIPLIKREISSRTASYVTSIESLLKASNKSSERNNMTANSTRQIGLGIYYIERPPLLNTRPGKKLPRQNYKRLQP